MVTKVLTLNCNVPEPPLQGLDLLFPKSEHLPGKRLLSALLHSPSDCLRICPEGEKQFSSGVTPGQQVCLSKLLLVSRPGDEVGLGGAVCPVIPPFCAAGASLPCSARSQRGNTAPSFRG